MKVQDIFKKTRSPVCSFREMLFRDISLLVLKHAGEAGHRTLLVWLSAQTLLKPRDRDNRCCCRNTRHSRSLCNTEVEEQVVMHHRSAPKQKDELMRCTCCLLYPRCVVWQPDAKYRMPMSIGSFSYTRSGLVSLARSHFCRSPT